MCEIAIQRVQKLMDEYAEEAEDDGSEAEETSAWTPPADVHVDFPAAATVSAAAVSEAVAQCLLLPSPFAAAGRPPTLYFERPVGQPPRPGLPTVPYRGGAPPSVKLELNANSVRNALKSAGFKVVKGVSSVRLLWARHTGSNLWTQLPRGAIVNHFPGSWVLGRKDGLAKSLHAQQRRLGALGMAEAYSFVPRTYILPQDRPSLERAAERGALRGGGVLIVKPQNSSRGRGIRLVSSVAEVCAPRPHTSATPLPSRLALTPLS